MLMEGQIVKLNNNKEYIVIKKINAHSFNYVYLISSDKPIEFLVATEKVDNGKTILEEIKDNNELDYALTILKSI